MKRLMSAIGTIADIASCTAHVRFGGKADMAVCENPLSRSLSGVKRDMALCIAHVR